jgi:hypothetical protein
MTYCHYKNNEHIRDAEGHRLLSFETRRNILAKTRRPKETSLKETSILVQCYTIH